MEVLCGERSKGAARSRDTTPSSVADVNFNSPGHQSSQDGSFIQDEDNMQLILDFGRRDIPRGAENLCCDGATLIKTRGGQFGRGVVSESTWRGQSAQRATDFDANVAELDFDDFATKDIVALGGGKFARFVDVWDSSSGVGTLVYNRNQFGGTLRSPLNPGEMGVNNYQQIYNRGAQGDFNRNRMCHSVDVSLNASRCRSLMSSCGGDDQSDSIFEGFDFGASLLKSRQPAEATLTVIADGQPVGFISTDSLNMSSYNLEEKEALMRMVCATNKRDYMLTFDNKMGRESGIISTEGSDYLDAGLTDGSDRVVGDNSENGDDSRSESRANDSQSFTTWDRIKRSYEVERPKTEIYSSKCTSLPNLHGSPSHTAGDGAGEKMAIHSGGSGCGGEDKLLPIFDVGSMQSSSGDGSGGKERFSLFKVFKNKLAGAFLDRFQLPQSLTGSSHSKVVAEGVVEGGGGENKLDLNIDSNSSSGYVTCGGGGGLTPAIKPTETAALLAERKKNRNNNESIYDNLNLTEESVDLSRSQRRSRVSGSKPVAPQPTADWEYAEYFVDGKYIDVNHNEVGYVPPSTRPFQTVAGRSEIASTSRVAPYHHRAQSEEKFSPRDYSVDERPPLRRYSSLNRTNQPGPPSKPPRTFASLLSLREPKILDEFLAENIDGQGGQLPSFNQRKSGNGLSRTSVTRSQDSATQVPVYVVDQSVQTCSWDNGKLVAVVTTSVRQPTSNQSLYVSRTLTLNNTQPSQSRNYYNVCSSEIGEKRKPTADGRLATDLPDLSFMKLPPFHIPPLFPSVQKFPPSFCGSDSPPPYMPTASMDFSRLKAPSFASGPAIDPLNRLFLPSVLSSQLAYPAQVVLPDPPRKQFATFASLSASRQPSAGQISPNPGGLPAKDSGLGSSGPGHIQDWDSLQFLLPKEVVQAFSFFKANTNLLHSTSGSPGDLYSRSSGRVNLLSDSLNIDKPGRRSGGSSRAAKKLLSSCIRAERKKDNGRRRCRPHSEPMSMRFESIEEEKEFEERHCGPHFSHSCHVVSHCQPHQSCDCHSKSACQHQCRPHYQQQLDCSYHSHHSCVADRPSCCHSTRSCDCCGGHRRDLNRHHCGGHTCVKANICRHETVPKTVSYVPLNSGPPTSSRLGGCQCCSATSESRRTPCHKLEESLSNCSSVSLVEEEETSSEDDEMTQDYLLDQPVTYSEYTVRDREADPSRFFSLQNFRDYSCYHESPSDSMVFATKFSQGSVEQPKSSVVARHHLKNLNLVDSHSSAQSDDSCVKPCATCFKVRSPTLEVAASLCDNGENFCDCRTSDVMEEREKLQSPPRTRSSLSANPVGELRSAPMRKTVSFSEQSVAAKKALAEEKLRLSTACRLKKGLIDSVVESCETLMELFADEGVKVCLAQRTKEVGTEVKDCLCPAIEMLIADGLVEGKTVWTVVEASATLGPATKSIHELVADLSTSQNCTDSSAQFYAFIVGLLNLHSLDCWLSYLVLKDKILHESYSELGFMRRAAGPFCSLFAEAIAAIQPLSLLPFEQFRLNTAPPLRISPAKTSRVTFQPLLEFTYSTPTSSAETTPAQSVAVINAVETAKMIEKNSGDDADELCCYTRSPTKLPSDSRVPKSSSVPARLDCMGRSLCCSNPFASLMDFPLKSRSLDTGLCYYSNHPNGNIHRRTAQSDSLALQQKLIDVRNAKSDTPPYWANPDGSSGVRMAECDSLEVSRNSDDGHTDEIICTKLNARYVCAIDNHIADESGEELSFRKGETLTFVAECGQKHFRCARGTEEGLVPRAKVTCMTFL